MKTLMLFYKRVSLMLSVVFVVGGLRAMEVMKPMKSTAEKSRMPHSIRHQSQQKPRPNLPLCGYELLLAAAKQGSDQVLMLLQKGIDISQQATALCFAAMQDGVWQMNSLIDGGVNVNIHCSSHKKTALSIMQL